MIPSPRYLVERILQHFLKPHMHDVREHATLCVPRPLTRSARKIEHIGLRHQRLEGRAEPLLQPLSIMLRDLKPMDDISRHVTTRAEE
jgi:hypothetical protein